MSNSEGVFHADRLGKCVYINILVHILTQPHSFEKDVTQGKF